MLLGMLNVAIKKSVGASRRRLAKGAKRVVAEVPVGGLFAGREHVFGALSFKPVKGAAAKRLVHARIVADNHT